MDDPGITEYIICGTVGINLVFHLYEWIYHDRKYHKICEVLDNRLLRYIDTISEGEQNIEDFNTGIFSGEGSILYTLGILYEIYDIDGNKKYDGTIVNGDFSVSISG